MLDILCVFVTLSLLTLCCGILTLDKASVSNAPEPDPYRFVHAKLGLTAKEFEQHVNNDIDELLTEIECNRRQELLEQLSYERALSKEDCLKLLNGQELDTGSKWGMFRWAADLGIARFNFDFDGERDDISIFNAYD